MQGSCFNNFLNKNEIDGTELVKTISKPLTASQIGYVEPPNHKHE
jgi:hypothetical protein